MAVTPKFFNGDVHFVVDGRGYVATVEARGTYYFRKGCMYLRNGDPGHPDEEEFTIDDVDVQEVRDAETEEVVPYNETEMYDALEAALQDEDDWS